MSDTRQPTFGLRPPVSVSALPDDHPRVREWVARIARPATPLDELRDGFKGWINPDRERVA